jgi:hypothetical protein
MIHREMSRSRWIVVLLTSLAVLAGLVTTADASSGAHRPRVGTPADVSYDAKFIQFLQRPDGSILSSPNGQWIEPYLADYATWGLARAAAVTHDPSFETSAWKWLSWYAAHQDANGYVEDYIRNGTDFVPSGTMDSTDGTSGTYLSALWATATESKGQLAHLRHLWPAAKLAVSAIESTFDSDGLTWALSTYHVKYLMDNVEALGGMDAAYAMAQLMHDPMEAFRVKADALRLQTGIDSLWDPATGAYDWALHENGDRVPCDWTVLYPDTVEQGWAVAYGAVPADRAAALMNHVESAEPQWDQPTATANYYDGTVSQHTVDFWSIVGWGFDRVGHRAEAAEAAASIRSGAWSLNRQLPFTDGFQGQLIRLETGATDYPPAITTPQD